ncbi:uncharacterized protein N7515_002704 [Penicillium bovifimosum]|uniref:Aminoglycoside phosphotransferase domain-containing protein n=1 Tax=Penicillium bovifimosum TaxID=126998 RepID=A0A9W9HC66_9EURO|nr:uncharacterized protein N7515_002704 [Penicillium bovifimosum]KAJ5143917.1 hypothetical protein N7515_002704 [Penicillium bovifimosum]
MADREEWKRQERQFIDRFFQEKVPEALGNEAASLCTEDTCIRYAQALFNTDDIAAVNNQGSNSFTLQTPSTIIQFRLTPLKTDILALANEIYGDLVPKVNLHDGFLLPVYSSKVISGQIHLFQPFPEEFPLEREKTTVTELGLFIAKAAFFEQPKACVKSDSWTSTAPELLYRLVQNNSLKIYAPELFDVVRRLQHKVYLLESLPRVLTHHDFSQVNILVNDTGNITGVIDFDEAGIEAFGMCIWGLYECFFGSMEAGKWSFYHEMPVLANAFWGSLWANTPPSLKREEAQTAIKVSLGIGVLNRYFIHGMVDKIDLSKKVHRLSLEYARGILPRIWE